jgi:hypothetical protein
MNKIDSWIDTHFDELTSVKTLFVVFSVVLNIILMWGSHHLIASSDIAYMYIQELEEQIDDDIMDTIRSGDTYANYYNYE